MPKMNLHRAQELIVPLRNGTANDISLAWQARLIEALEYVIEHESQPTKPVPDKGQAAVVRDNLVIVPRG